MRKGLIVLALMSVWAATVSSGPDPAAIIAPSPQALCNAMLAIIGWDDLRESANATNPDRVRGSGLVRLLGGQLAAARGNDNPLYQLFSAPEPGQPHAVSAPPAPENVAAASTMLPPDGVPPKALVDRLGGLLYDGRNNWATTRYFFTPFDSLNVTEIASMWQRHARNATNLQERGQATFPGDQVLTHVQDAVERGLHGGRPFWAHIGFNSTVQGIGPNGSLEFPNAGAGYVAAYPAGAPVRVDYVLMFDPTNPQRPSGMAVILRFPP